jgi:hypothetical protein
MVPTALPPLISPSSLAMNALLCTVWLRITDIRHRLLEEDAVLSGSSALFPCKQYSDDASGAMIMPLLLDIYSTYRQNMEVSNPNYQAFWHYMCISLTANLELFELAAGREGRRMAEKALEQILNWAQSSVGRQTCLRAAQTYACMSNRRVVDGTTFVSEMSLFNSALVLGYYFHVSDSESYTRETGGSREPFELLAMVDWNLIDNCSFACEDGPPHPGASTVEWFIAEGGPVSFEGVTYQPGYRSRRRIMLKYVGLLEEVGRWGG